MWETSLPFLFEFVFVKCLHLCNAVLKHFKQLSDETLFHIGKLLQQFFSFATSHMHHSEMYWFSSLHARYLCLIDLSSSSLSFRADLCGENAAWGKASCLNIYCTIWRQELWFPSVIWCTVSEPVVIFCMFQNVAPWSFYFHIWCTLLHGKISNSLLNTGLILFKTQGFRTFSTFQKVARQRYICIRLQRFHSCKLLSSVHKPLLSPQSVFKLP